MQIGRFTIEQLSEGQFELFKDGKINRTPVSLLDDERASNKRDTLLGINPIYLTDGTHHILLDAGLGWGLDAGSPNTDVSNIRTNLKIFDIAPSHITHVILSHLHYDHIAGVSFTDEDAATRPTFPNARYVVQQAEWDFALEQVQHQSVHSQFYTLDDLYRLYADDYFELITDREKEILPGLHVLRTGGHTPGHQAVQISDDAGKSAYYLGDLVPTADQLNYFDVAAHDINRVQAKRLKTRLLRKIYEDNAYLYFYHDIASKAGRLQLDRDENYVLKEE